MLDRLSANNFAKLLEGMADPTRLRILTALKNGPLTVSDLGKVLEITIVNISHHLGIMRNGNILLSEKQGRCIHYRLNPNFFKIEEGRITFITAWCVINFA
jgi:ArsR family transcriptional regulator, nickel/cobalt-responsive transcriptional repressor